MVALPHTGPGHGGTAIHAHVSRRASGMRRIGRLIRTIRPVPFGGSRFRHQPLLLLVLAGVITATLIAVIVTALIKR